jgi:predicted nucleic acid-binding protein
MNKYRDSRIDFVDSVIAAIAERLDIRTILTVDRRHFQLLRPQKFTHFIVLP